MAKRKGSPKEEPESKKVKLENCFHKYFNEKYNQPG